ncbi:MAG: hypothetical protein H7126_15230 [Candidatus Parcubacteria bacterium]|nr:hypothetical protein [Leptolyngbyaceae cyanobacterium LF-bin-113]
MHRRCDRDPTLRLITPVLSVPFSGLRKASPEFHSRAGCNRSQQPRSTPRSRSCRSNPKLPLPHVRSLVQKARSFVQKTRSLLQEGV